MNQSLVKPENWKRLILKLRGKYAPLCRDSLLSPDDIEQEALLALCRAAETYDERHGVQFSTYAYSVINRNVYRFVNRTIKKHIPGGLLEDTVSSSEFHESDVDKQLDADAILSRMRNPEWVRMSLCDGLSYREIARRIGNISHEIVRRSVLRDLERMQEHYERIGDH